MGKSQTRRRSKKWGGKYLGEGTYGCGFYPALYCKDDGPNRKKDTLSKLMLQDHADEEWRAHKLLHSVDPDQLFFLYPTNKCKPDFKRMRELKNGENNLEACTIYTKKLMKRPYDAVIIESRMGGKDLYSITLNTGQYLPFFKGFEQLLEGLTLLHLKDIVHLDIKDKNLVAEQGNSGRFDFHFIDFGFACAITDFDKTYPAIPVDSSYVVWPYDTRFSSTSFTEEQIDTESIEEWKALGKKYFGSFLFLPEIQAFREEQYKEEFNKLSKGDRTEMLKIILKGTDVYSLGLVLGQLWYRFIGHSHADRLVKTGKILAKKNSRINSPQEKWHSDVAKNVSKPLFELVADMMQPDLNLRISAEQAYERYKNLLPLFDKYLTREQLGPTLRILFPTLPSPQPVPPTPHGFEHISTNLFQSPNTLVAAPPNVNLPMRYLLPAPPPYSPPEAIAAPVIPPPSPYYSPRPESDLLLKANNFSTPPVWVGGKYTIRKIRKTRKQRR